MRCINLRFTYLLTYLLLKFSLGVFSLFEGFVPVLLSTAVVYCSN